ncbi:uncharacterized protein MEPE_02468 [Melanopsichium pennsylvanicum]|uniref:Autophagy-related protein 14 n=2 Tax=Melanopsichium pennsylvanicum TaxID=63383 RepID=A0AAJ5C4J7_9BASI|nr:ubiquitin 60s ribosomal protein l40 fusion [Melanopsichium pennsylvanicum 4]SNX83760.1 uncharacterized protein MEPE_02468 [Melanopsichium pennsylvanicum]
MSASSPTPSESFGNTIIPHEQRRIGHICAILVRNLSLRPTRDRALQTLTSTRPGGSSQYHITSDDADLTLSLARSNSKGKDKANGLHRPRRSASWSRHGIGLSDDEGHDEVDANSASTSASSKSYLTARNNGLDHRGRSGSSASFRRTSDHELTTTSSLSSSIEASPRPILKRSSSTKDGRDARTSSSPGESSASSFLDELGANTIMLSRSDSRSSSHSSHTIRRSLHRARTTSMASSTSIRSVRFDESHVGANDGVKWPLRISGRLNVSSRYALFSQRSLAQIMTDRMLECCVELSLIPSKIGNGAAAGVAETDSEPQTAFYRTSDSKPGLHHSWGYLGGDPITPERDFGLNTDLSTLLEASRLSIKVCSRSPPAQGPGVDAKASSISSKTAKDWKIVRQTSVDLRDLEPLPGNLQDATLALPPNSILLGLAPGANSLSGRANLTSPDSQTEPGGAPALDEAKSGPKLTRQVSEREAERTRHILESIIYYVIPLIPGQQGAAGKHADEGTTHADKGKSQAGRDASLSRSPTLRRRASVEGYASDPESAANCKTAPKLTAMPASSMSNTTVLPTASAALTSEARRRERRKAFEDEQRRALELSLRETKMMPSYNLDQARSLAKKQAKLQDLLSEVDELRHQNGELLNDRNGPIQLRLKQEEQKARYAAVRQMAVDEGKSLAWKRSELEGRKAAVEGRRNAIQAFRSLFETADATSCKLRRELDALKSKKAELAVHIHAQRVLLLRDLEIIFPIELSDASSLLFSICGLPLPNAVASLASTELSTEEKRWKETLKRSSLPPSSRPVFHPFDDDTMSTAFGLVAQLVVLLSTYLGTPIHYPLATAGSRAVVQDTISLMSGPRAFPLYSKGMEKYRYEYAAFLLNKDIEQLMSVHSVTVIDIRHTLPNLKNLMVTVSAAAGPASIASRKSHIGKNEISLRSAKSSMSLMQRNGGDGEEAGDGAKVIGGQANKPELGLGLGLPTLTGGAKVEPAQDTLMTTRVLGAPSKPTATPATASGAISSVTRALSYFSGGTR